MAKFKKIAGFAQIPIMVGLLLMAVALPAMTKLVQNNQENRSKATVACDYTFFDQWGICYPSGFQTRQIKSILPAGCQERDVTAETRRNCTPEAQPAAGGVVVQPPASTTCDNPKIPLTETRFQVINNVCTSGPVSNCLGCYPNDKSKVECYTALSGCQQAHPAAENEACTAGLSQTTCQVGLTCTGGKCVAPTDVGNRVGKTYWYSKDDKSCISYEQTSVSDTGPCGVFTCYDAESQCKIYVDSYQKKLVELVEKYCPKCNNPNDTVDVEEGVRFTCSAKPQVCPTDNQNGVGQTTATAADCTQCFGGTACGQFSSDGGPYKCECSGSGGSRVCNSQLAPEVCTNKGKDFKQLTGTTGDCVDKCVAPLTRNASGVCVATVAAINCTGTSSSVALTDKRWVYTGTVCSELAVGGNCKNCGGDKDCYTTENGCKLDHPVAPVADSCPSGSICMGAPICAAEGSKVTGTCSNKNYVCCKINETDQTNQSGTINCTGTSSSVALTDKRWVYTGTVCSELAVGGNCKNCGGDKDCYTSENGCKLDHPVAAVCTPCANDSDNIKRKSGRFSCTSAKADKSDFDIWVGEYTGDGRKVIKNNYQADANCDGYVSLVDFAIWLENKLK
ncbi:MAG: hypothetical protein Q8P53_00610 [Candidatus Shapirobacteria bacterium]|nr:hypothetical protein [Candidatus Shapirobacteria bacterium]